MRLFLTGLLVAVFGLTVQKSFSQEKFAVIEKNTNLVAKDLFHDLNRSQDTLILRSKGLMHRVYAINRQNKREVDEFINGDEIEIPIQDLSSGKHVFAVNYLQKIILFVVRVYDPNATYVDMRKETDVAVRNN